MFGIATLIHDRYADCRKSPHQKPKEQSHTALLKKKKKKKKKKSVHPHAPPRDRVDPRERHNDPREHLRPQCVPDLRALVELGALQVPHSLGGKRREHQRAPEQRAQKLPAQRRHDSREGVG
jgi:hypothetical protein